MDPLFKTYLEDLIKIRQLKNVKKSNKKVISTCIFMPEKPSVSHKTTVYITGLIKNIETFSKTMGDNWILRVYCDNMYFTGDGAYRDADGNFRITGRVDDVIIVSGHNLGTAPIEDVINEHKNVAESAIVGFPHEIKGNALYGFVTLKDSSNVSDNTKDEINKLISDKIGPIAKLDKMQLTEALPKTRSGKIMRRILRKIAENDFDNLGDISTLLNPEAVEAIIKNNIR